MMHLRAEAVIRGRALGESGRVMPVGGMKWWAAEILLQAAAKFNDSVIMPPGAVKVVWGRR